MPKPPNPEREPSRFLNAHQDAPSDPVFGIGELAELLETTPRAIRFYEEKGLISPTRVGQTRVYGKRERARLELILRGKSLGISLRDIRAYLDLYGERGEGRRKQLEHAVARAEEMIDDLERRRREIDRTLSELRIIREVSRERLRAASTKRTGRPSNE